MADGRYFNNRFWLIFLYYTRWQHKNKKNTAVKNEKYTQLQKKN